MEAARPKKYLVLGSDGHGRSVRSYQWDRLPAGLNVADYDVVILNFAAFENLTLADGFPTNRLPDRQAFARLLFAPKSEIVAIGDPSTPIGPPPSEDKPWFDSRWRADYFLPCWIGVEKDQGDSYNVGAQEWQSYYDQLAGWDWIATGETGPSDTQASHYLEPVTSEANGLALQVEPLVQTRFQKAIGLRLDFKALHVSYETDSYFSVEPIRGTEQLVSESSPVFWLPKPDRVSPSEGIDIILRDRYGIAAQARLPQWATDYQLPDEDEIAKEIAQHEAERAGAEARLLAARQRAEDAARPRLLLYEKGKDSLEPVARETLRQLGARVEDPESEGIEDGLLFVAEQAAVIEIKGRRNQIKQDDVRQVVQWASDAKLRDGASYKPLIIGNPNCELPPSERGEPLAPNALQYAQRGDVGLVTTTHLYEALRQQQTGDLDQSAFWDAVFAAKGLADLDDVPSPGDAASDEASNR